MKKTALAFGEVLWDVYPDKRCIGGAPLNFAAHFVRCGGSAGLISAVGRDTLGDETLRSVSELGVDTAYISRVDEPTGRCTVTLDEKAVPTYRLLENVAYDRIAAPQAPQGDLLYFGTLALRGRQNRQSLESILANGRFSQIFADINLRKPFVSDETVRFAMEHATVLKLSEEELPEAMAHIGVIDRPDPLRAATELAARFENLRLILVTLGAEGALAYEPLSDSVTTCKAQKVSVVSTVGAGDSFSAAFAAYYLQGKPIAECMELASRVSGFVVSRKEAIPEYTLAMMEEAL